MEQSSSLTHFPVGFDTVTKQFLGAVAPRQRNCGIQNVIHWSENLHSPPPAPSTHGCLDIATTGEKGRMNSERMEQRGSDSSYNPLPFCQDFSNFLFKIT